MSLITGPSIWNSLSVDPSLVSRVTVLEGKYVRTSRFVSIGAGTSGTISLPANSTVVLDDFGGTVDAIVTQMSGGRPLYASAVDSGGNIISTTFDSSGNYSFSATPSAYPVALVYRVQQTLVNFDSAASDIVGSPQTNDGGGIYVKKSGDTMTGTLVSPKVSFKNTLDSFTLDVGWNVGNNRYEFSSNNYGINFNSSDFNLISNGAANLNFGASGSGDFAVRNDYFSSDIFRASSDGSVYIRSANDKGIYLDNSSNTSSLKKINLNNGFDIWDYTFSIIDLSVEGFGGGNFSIGAGSFSGGAPSGNGNMSIGRNNFANANPVAGSSNIAIGIGNYEMSYLDSTASSNIAIGSTALNSLSTGANNIAIGTEAMLLALGASNNISIGNQSLSSLTSGNGNTAMGISSGLSTTTGSDNFFLGASAGQYNTTGYSNTYLGISAGSQLNGIANTAIGAGSMVGASGGQSVGNIAIGLNLLPSINTGGDYNIVIGYGAGASGAITTGKKNLIIGYDSDVPTGTASNQMSIGNAIYGTGISSAVGTNISNAFIGLGVKAPTSRLHIRAGTATANESPLKFTSGTNLTTPENGAVEYDGSDLMITTGGTRKFLDKILRGSATLDFPNTSSNSSSDLTITVTGATDGDPVSVGVPNSCASLGGLYFGFVSAANTVTVRFHNATGGSVNPPSATFKVTVSK